MGPHATPGQPQFLHAFTHPSFAWPVCCSARVGYLDVGGLTLWNWERVAPCGHALKVERDRLLHERNRLVPVVPGRHAPVQVRRVSRVTRRRRLQDDQIPHGASPACRRMLLSVFGARIFGGCPATVTRPGLVGCLNCRWLDRCRSRYQPSASMSLMASRTVTVATGAESVALAYAYTVSAGRRHRKGRRNGAGGRDELSDRQVLL